MVEEKKAAIEKEESEKPHLDREESSLEEELEAIGMHLGDYISMEASQHSLARRLSQSQRQRAVSEVREEEKVDIEEKVEAEKVDDAPRKKTLKELIAERKKK